MNRVSVRITVLTERGEDITIQHEDVVMAGCSEAGARRLAAKVLDQISAALRH